jgi:cation diffusion facilitator family transporter
VLIASAGWHLTIAILKAGYGWKIHSVSMMADGFHSGIHASGVLFAIGGIYLASRPPDAEHPYGYERYEPLTAMGVGVLMIAAIFAVVNTAIEHTRIDQKTVTDPGSFAVMALSIVGAGALGAWERRSARALSSTVLHADARRNWSAALVSLSVVIGLVFSTIGLEFADLVVAFAVVAAIAWTAWRTIREASRILTDAAAADVGQIAVIALSVPGVRGCHEVRARGVAGRVRIDLHVTVAPQMTVAEAHDISEEVERRVQETIEGVAEVLVHIGAAKSH